jgi:hypothetical protein
MKPLPTAFCVIGLTMAAFARDVDIAVTELPAAVSASIEKAHPGAILLSAEKNLNADGGVRHYEVKIRVADRQKELTVLPDGTIRKDEKDD